MPHEVDTIKHLLGGSRPSAVSTRQILAPLAFMRDATTAEDLVDDSQPLHDLYRVFTLTLRTVEFREMVRNQERRMVGFRRSVDTR